MESIESIVVFDQGAAPTGETTATPAATQQRDDQGQFKAEAKPEQIEAPVTPEVKPVEVPEVKAEKGQISALLAERGKRQSAEAELQALRAKVAELEGKPSETDIFTDPDKAIAERVNKQLAPIRQRFFDQSVKTAAAAHSDFEDVAKSFGEMLDADPTLHARWLESEDPGEFIYTVGSTTPQFREKQTSQYREQLSAKDSEIASLNARLKELEGSRKALSEVPESLNKQPSGAVPVRNDADYDINNIVRFK